MPDIPLENAGRVVEDFIDGRRHFSQNALGAGIDRGHLLHGQQLERVERDGHLPREEFEELQVVLVESTRLGAFDVERSQDFVVQDQRYGERAARPGTPGRYKGSVVVSSHK